MCGGDSSQHKQAQTATDTRRQLRCSGTCLSSNGRGYYIAAAGNFERNKIGIDILDGIIGEFVELRMGIVDFSIDISSD